MWKLSNLFTDSNIVLFSYFSVFSSYFFGTFLDLGLFSVSFSIYSFSLKVASFNAFFCLIFLYVCLILSVVQRADTFDFAIETGTFTFPWRVSPVSTRTISSGILKMFFFLLASLIFSYSSPIFLAASYAFLPGCKTVMSSKVFMVSSLSLISSLSGSVSFNN